MRLVRDFLGIFATLIIVYLVLINFTGFTKDVATLGQNTALLAATFQGRAT